MSLNSIYTAEDSKSYCISASGSRKLIYLTYYEANIGREGLQRSGKIDKGYHAQVYVCKICGHFHVGTTKNKQ